jgi:hypothetical protein
MKQHKVKRRKLSNGSITSANQDTDEGISPSPHSNKQGMLIMDL